MHCIYCNLDKQQSVSNQKCIDCEHARIKAWKIENKEKVREYHKTPHAKASYNKRRSNYFADPIKGEERRARRRMLQNSHIDSPARRYNCLVAGAKARDLELTISKQMFIEICNRDEPCFYCNGMLDTDKRKGHRLDRLDNNLGYTLENVVTCCGFCNKIKREILSPEEAKVAIKAIIEYRCSV